MHCVGQAYGLLRKYWHTFACNMHICLGVFIRIVGNRDRDRERHTERESVCVCVWSLTIDRRGKRVCELASGMSGLGGLVVACIGDAEHVLITDGNQQCIASMCVASMMQYQTAVDSTAVGLGSCGTEYRSQPCDCRWQYNSSTSVVVEREWS
jgi:hypothetical protein